MNLRGKVSSTACFVTAAAEAAEWKSLALFKDVGKREKSDGEAVLRVITRRQKKTRGQ